MSYSLRAREITDGSSFALINPGIEENTVELRTAYSDVRQFLVEDTSATKTFPDGTSAIFDYKMAVVNSVGIQIGNIHPKEKTLWCTEISAQFLGNNNALVTVSYGDKPPGKMPGMAQVSIGSRAVDLPDCRDYKGKLITHTSKSDGTKLYGKAYVVRHFPVVTVSMDGRSSNYALEMAMKYADTVSDGGTLPGYSYELSGETWKYSSSKRATWLVSNVGYTPSGIGNVGTVHFEFSFDPFQWAQYPRWFTKGGAEVNLNEDDFDMERDYRKFFHRETEFPLQFVSF